METCCTKSSYNLCSLKIVWNLFCSNYCKEQKLTVGMDLDEANTLAGVLVASFPGLHHSSQYEACQRHGCTTRDGTYVKALTIHSVQWTMGFNTCSLALLEQMYYSLDTINMLGVACCPSFISYCRASPCISYVNDQSCCGGLGKTLYEHTVKLLRDISMQFYQWCFLLNTNFRESAQNALLLSHRSTVGDWRCEACNRNFEKKHRKHSDSLAVCPTTVSGSSPVYTGHLGFHCNKLHYSSSPSVHTHTHVSVKRYYSHIQSKQLHTFPKRTRVMLIDSIKPV